MATTACHRMLVVNSGSVLLGVVSSATCSRCSASATTPDRAGIDSAADIGPPACEQGHPSAGAEP